MRLESAADFLARQPRKFQIQHHDARNLLSKSFQSSYAIGRNLHLQPIGLEQAL